MPDYVVLRQIVLGASHQPTGKTRHSHGAEELPPPTELKIVQFPDDSGFYLLYFDQDGIEMTDTFHDSERDAMSQAEWEFNVLDDDWKITSL